MHVAGDCDDVRNTGDNPEEPVRPTDKEPGAKTKNVGNEVGEGLVLGVRKQNLTHGAQHEVDDATDNCVDEDDGGAGQRNSLCRAEEEAGADSAANSDELDMPEA